MNDLYSSLLELTGHAGTYDAWESYRATLTSFILSRAKNSGTCLIVGAGVCGDIDLDRISAGFSSVSLLDTDIDAMAVAAAHYKQSDVSLIKRDLLGVTPENYRALDAVISSGIGANRSGEELTEEFLKEMDTALLNAKPDPIPKADTVICCGVHSQLLAMFARMAAVYSRYSYMDLGRIYRQISGYNAVLQPVFNTRLLQSAQKTLILGLETERLSVPGGIEGAAQALADVRSRGWKAEQVNLLWPFDIVRNKVYSIEILAVDAQTVK